jgi:hypothetical protein
MGEKTYTKVKKEAVYGEKYKDIDGKEKKLKKDAKDLKK